MVAHDAMIMSITTDARIESMWDYFSNKDGATCVQVEIIEVVP
jgi:hypothetical protein